jgi:DNA-binding MarR family transcriptional regulator/N-acetylglutamate synthase-like GNAT family acetyltransferase
MREGQVDGAVTTMRSFNRFYTQRIGVLQEGLLASPFSLAEARVLYELGQRDTTTAGELARDLGLDAGYLSRILRRFTQQKLLARTPSPRDGRQQVLALTVAGREAFDELDSSSQAQVGALLSGLGPDDQQKLIGAMATIQRLLGAAQPRPAMVMLRSHRPGDMGWVVQRHGALYAQEYGWDASFEALVATIVARFLEAHDPRRERCWIAEVDGAPAGCVFLVRKAEGVAQLRLLLVEPTARGMGIGARLVDECTRFAREAGYHSIMLWTNSVLTGARRIYERAGYTLTSSEPHHSFGHDLVGEFWELAL